jgi:hypothetical protein
MAVKTPDRYWMSRSFVLALVAVLGAFVLSYLLDNATPATVIVPVSVTTWFGGKVLKKDNPTAVKPDRYWMSRSFVIVMTSVLGAFVLAYLLGEATIATVIVPAALTGWFGGKILKRNGT